jgi:hypothetical protein
MPAVPNNFWTNTMTIHTRSLLGHVEVVGIFISENWAQNGLITNFL